MYVVTVAAVYVPARLLPSARPGEDIAWLAFPISAVPELAALSTSNVASTLVRGLKSCALVETAEGIGLVELLVEQHSEGRFQTCGEGIAGGGFIDGRSLRAVYEEQTPDAWHVPSGTSVRTVTEQDADFSALVAELHTAFSPD